MQRELTLYVESNALYNALYIDGTEANKQLGRKKHNHIIQTNNKQRIFVAAREKKLIISDSFLL